MQAFQVKEWFSKPEQLSKPDTNVVPAPYSTYRQTWASLGDQLQTLNKNEK
jgi:hypothetical protein